MTRRFTFVADPVTGEVILWDLRPALPLFVDAFTPSEARELFGELEQALPHRRAEEGAKAALAA